MKKHIVILLCAWLLLAGCTIKVIPQQVPHGVINPADNSQIITRDGIAIKAANAEREIVSYNLDGTVTAFDVTVHNQTDREAGFGADSFLLLDDQSRQYQPLSPEKVKEIVSRDSYYLIPYPYIGFYYLEDYEKTTYYNETKSYQLPYYFEVYPQDLFTRALDAGSVIPGAKASGLVYFRIDLAGVREMKLLVFRKGTSKSSPPDFIFPFIVNK
ncbi:MAG: hypothetical protein ED859_09550 [Desulfuromonadales bacterium]|nr:MAG: hypothetical protein ED859_09550 [Desulfuromonadales bacterium]